MKGLNRLTLTAGLALFALLVLPFAYAQQGPGPGQRARMYNPANETTVKGTVEEVKTVTGRRAWSATHLTLKTGDKTFNVHLGPSSFLKEKGFNIAKGDQIEVTGATAEFRGSQALIAREVKKGSETLVLRDAQGIPKWSRGRRR
ncbi:MAG: DNA-binding protein [Terriglobia bacterium]|jgi:DNA/RNA endonuclease YhcR with UshA esterase domain